MEHRYIGLMISVCLVVLGSAFIIFRYIKKK